MTLLQTVLDSRAKNSYFVSKIALISVVFLGTEKNNCPAHYTPILVDQTKLESIENAAINLIWQ